MSKLNITQYRNALKDVLASTGHEVKVQLSPLDYGKGSGSFGEGMEDLKLNARIVVGNPSDEADVLIDKLVDEVPDLVSEDRTLGGVVSDADVTYCSGHRLYATGPNEPPLAGAEWTVKVVMK